MAESELPEYSGLLLSRPAPGVMEVALNRPKRLNAVDLRFWTDFREVFQKIGGDPSVRCVVITGGQSRHFTVGLDLRCEGIQQQMLDRSEDPARAALQLMSLAKSWASTFDAVENIPQPVLIAVHGACIGAGVDLAAACNVRLAATDSSFSIKEVDIGLAADVGSLQRLPKLIGNASVLHELALTGRTFSAQEALDFGLVGRVVDGGATEVRSEAVKLASMIAAKSPVAIVGIKRFLNFSRDHSVGEALAFAATWNAAMLQSHDMEKAQMGFVTKQAPTFDDLPPSKL